MTLTNKYHEAKLLEIEMIYSSPIEWKLKPPKTFFYIFISIAIIRTAYKLQNRAQNRLLADKRLKWSCWVQKYEYNLLIMICKVQLSEIKLLVICRKWKAAKIKKFKSIEYKSLSIKTHFKFFYGFIIFWLFLLQSDSKYVKNVSRNTSFCRILPMNGNQRWYRLFEAHFHVKSIELFS